MLAMLTIIQVLLSAARPVHSLFCESMSGTWPPFSQTLEMNCPQTGDKMLVQTTQVST